MYTVKNIMKFVTGFIPNRIRRWLRKPDMDMIYPGFYIGGRTNDISVKFEVIDLTKILPEGPYVSPDVLDGIVRTIDWYLNKDRFVFVHCRVGRGRAPMVAACVMTKYELFDMELSKEYVTSCRPHVCWTPAQEESMKDYEVYIK